MVPPWFSKRILGFCSSFNAPHLWIGAVGTNRLFAWIKNSQPVFTDKWLKGNPDSSNPYENCLHFWENTTLLNDRKCDVKQGYICEENDNLSEDYTNQEKYKNIIFNMVNKN